MAAFKFIFTFLILHFNFSAADQNSYFVYKTLGKDPTFESRIALYGGAKVVNGGSTSTSVQLTSPTSHAGRVMYKNPIRLVEEGKRRRSSSFSTNFSFSLSKENGDGLAFVLVPTSLDLTKFDGRSFGLFPGLNKNQSRVVSVEFDTFRNVRYGDSNGNHVGIDLGSLLSVETKNLSAFNLVLNSGEKLYSWIDYEANWKRLEVRLSKYSSAKPVDPVISYPIDLSRIWNDEEIFMGLSSSNGNSSQTCQIYSWSLKVRSVPGWMHSEPMDPKDFVKNEKTLVAKRKSDCVLRMLAALILGAACGALGAFLVLYLWAIFGSKRPVVPEESDDFVYKEVKVVVVVDREKEKGIKDDGAI